MSDRLECPGCNSETSTILARVPEGEPCPYCGLSASTIMEVLAARRRNADAALITRVEDWESK